MKSVLSLAACAFIFVTTAPAQVPTPAPSVPPSLKPATVPTRTPDKSIRPTPVRGRTRLPPRKADLPQQWPESSVVSEIPDQANLQETRARELFEKAKGLLSQRKPDEALPLLRDAEKLEPKRYEIQLQIGVTLEILRRKDEAVTAFQNAVKFNPQSADAHYLLCRGLADFDKHREGIVECREAVRLAPAQTRFQTLLATLYLFDNRAAEAVELLGNVGVRSQDNIGYLGTLGDAYFMSGEYALSASLYEKIAGRWPEVTITYLRLSDVYDYLDRPNDSITAAKKYAELEPRFVLAQLNLGEKYQAAGFIDEAISAYTQAISFDKNCGEAYIGLTAMYEITGDEDAMVDSVKNAYRLLPRTVPLALKYGDVLSDSGNAAGAIEPLEWANSKQPNWPDIMRSLAFAYLKVNRDQEGAALMVRANQISPLPPGIEINIDLKAKKDLMDRFDELLAAVKNDPSDVGSRRQLAFIYENKGMLKEAEEQYLAVLKLDPTDHTYNLTAIFYADHQQYEKALPMIRKATELNQHHVLYGTLAHVLAKLGRLDEAIAAAEKAVEIKPTSLEYHLYLGWLLLKKGDRPKALHEYQTGFELASGDPRPNFKLAWLYVRMGNKEGAFRHYSILKGIVPNQLEYLEACLHGRFGELP